MNWIKKIWPKKGEGKTQQSIGGALSPAYGLDLQSPEEFINRANKRAVKGDISGAIADFDAAIDLNPAKATAFYNRGYLHNLAGHHQQAIIDCSDAIALLPDYDEAFYQRGLAHQELGDIDAAIVDLSEVLRLNPFSIKAYYKRASCYAALNDVQGAIADYTQAIVRIPKDANAYLQRGLFLTQMQEYRTAIEDFSSALSFNPKSADAYYHRGYCYAELGDKEKATQDFNQAMLYDPNQRAEDSNRHYALGILKKSKNLPPAGSVQESESSQDETVWLQDEEPVVLSIDPSTPDLVELSSIDDTEALNSTDLRQAISGMESESATTQSDDSVITEVIPSQSVTPASAQKGLSAANIEHLFEVAQGHVNHGQVDEAIAVYSQIIEFQPGNTQAYIERGKNLKVLGQADAAEADMEAAVYWAKQKSLDLMKDYSGSISQTLADLKQSIARAKVTDNSSALAPLDNNQSIEGAILKHSQAIHRNPLDPQAYFERGKSRALLGDLEGAIDDYTRTITLDENYRDAYYKRGLLLGALGDVEGATQDMNKAIRRKPMLPASISPSNSDIGSPATTVQNTTPPDESAPNDGLNTAPREPQSSSSEATQSDQLNGHSLNSASPFGQDPAVSSPSDVMTPVAEVSYDPIEDSIEELLNDDMSWPGGLAEISEEDDDLQLKSEVDQKIAELLHRDEIDELLSDSGYEADQNYQADQNEVSENPLETDQPFDTDIDLDATLLLNRPSAALVKDLPPPSEVAPEPEPEDVEIDADPTLVMPVKKRQEEDLLAEEDAVPENFNAFSRQTWVPEGDSGQPAPTYFSDLVLEPCTHEGNNPENRFCIHCGQEIRPNL